MTPAVVLFSGGLDSTTTLVIALERGFDAHALSFDYGQRHNVELDCARRIADKLKVPHHIVNLDLRQFGGSALTADIDVPEAGQEGIPTTYVPARNTVFLSIALAYAETLGADDIFVGVSSVDYSGYPDCRPEFIHAFEAMANLATKRAIEGNRMTIHAPLLHVSKADTIRLGVGLGVDYSMTHSCYDPVGPLPCGRCDSCALRAEAFADVAWG